MFLSSLHHWDGASPEKPFNFLGPHLSDGAENNAGRYLSPQIIVRIKEDHLFKKVL